MTKMTTLLVGSSFRMGGQQLLSGLPSGQKLWLVKEPDNVYDSNAIKVMLSVVDIEKEFVEELNGRLAGTGLRIEDLGNEWQHVGYVAKTGGKPLQGLELPGNEEFLAEMEGEEPRRGELSFNANGKPLVSLMEAEALRDYEEDEEDEDYENYEE